MTFIFGKSRFLPAEVSPAWPVGDGPAAEEIVVEVLRIFVPNDDVRPQFGCSCIEHRPRAPYFRRPVAAIGDGQSVQIKFLNFGESE